MPVTLGANVSWNIGNLWTNKNKVTEARIQQKEIGIQKSIVSDQLKTEINRNYQNYQLSLKKLRFLKPQLPKPLKMTNCSLQNIRTMWPRLLIELMQRLYYIRQKSI